MHVGFWGIMKLREVPLVIDGPANAPVAPRVSTNRHGVTGTKRRAPPVVGEVLPPFTENVTAFDTPPPGAGLETVTWSHPTDAISAAPIETFNCVEFTNEVVRILPLNFTTDVEAKLIPFTVRVKEPVPAALPVGEIELTLGTG